MEEMRDFLLNLAEYIDESVDPEEMSVDDLIGCLFFVENELSCMAKFLNDECCDDKRTHFLMEHCGDVVE